MTLATTHGTGLFHDCTAEACSRPHVGYRYWRFDADLDLPLAVPYMSASTGWPARTGVTTTCPDDYDHTMPGEHCSCGIRFAPTWSAIARCALAEFRKQHAEWWRVERLTGQSYRDLMTSQRYPRVLDHWVLGSVRVWGRLLRGSPEDPFGICRAENAGIDDDLDVLHVPATLADHAGRIEEVYGARVVVHDTVGYRFLADLLDDATRQVCSACGMNDQPLNNGLCSGWKQCCLLLADRLARGQRV